MMPSPSRSAATLPATAPGGGGGAMATSSLAAQGDSSRAAAPVTMRGVKRMGRSLEMAQGGDSPRRACEKATRRGGQCCTGASGARSAVRFARREGEVWRWNEGCGRVLHPHPSGGRGKGPVGKAGGKGEGAEVYFLAAALVSRIALNSLPSFHAGHLVERASSSPIVRKSSISCTAPSRFQLSSHASQA